RPGRPSAQRLVLVPPTLPSTSHAVLSDAYPEPMALGFVRSARPDDVGEIARIQLTTWRVAYRRLMPRRVLEQLDENWIAQQWERAITDPPTPRHRVLVAGEQATDRATPAYVVGFVAAGPPGEAALAPHADHTALGDE